METLINVSNCPSSSWSTAQLKGWNVKDIEFPEIPARITNQEIGWLINDMLAQIVDITENDVMDYLMDEDRFIHNVYVMMIGDPYFVSEMYQMLKSETLNCRADSQCVHLMFPISERKVLTDVNGVKTERFDFVKWRDVELNW